MAKDYKNKVNRKLSALELTDREREILAKHHDSEFFQIIAKRVLPQRRMQLALTAVELDQTMEQLMFHKGMIAACKWLPNAIQGEAKFLDAEEYDNEDDDVSAEDDRTVS